MDVNIWYTSENKTSVAHYSVQYRGKYNYFLVGNISEKKT